MEQKFQLFLNYCYILPSYSKADFCIDPQQRIIYVTVLGGSFIFDYTGDVKFDPDSIFYSLPEGAALLGDDISIKLVNQKWKEMFAGFNLSPEKTGPGNKYHEILAETGCNDKTIENIKDGIINIVKEDGELFKKEIFLEYNGIERRFEIKVSPHKNGALVLQEDITPCQKYDREKETEIDGVSRNNLKPQVVERELEMTKFSLDNADVMVFRVTPRGKILYVNKTTREKLGYSPVEMKNMDVRNILREDEWVDREKFWQRIKQNNSISYEKELVTAEGEVFPASVVSQYFQYKDEEYEFVFARDITERKQMEKKLRIREHQYRKTFETAPIGMELKNSDGIIIDVNDKLCEMTGYEKEELIGSCFIDTVVPEGYEEKAREDFEKLLSGESLEQVLHSRDKSDEKYYINLKETMVQLPEGEKGVLTMRTNITERVEAERRLKEEKNRFQSLAETSPFGLFVYREKFEYVNPALEEMTGYSSEEILRKNFWELTAPEHKEMVKERGYARLKGEKPVSSYEYKIKRKDGEKIWVLFSGTQIKYEGEPAGIGTLIDISELKETQKKLRVREEQYRKIFETAPVGIMLEDREGNILEVNESLCEISGFDEDELVGSNVLETLVPEEYKQEARENIDRIMSGEETEFTAISRRKSGEKFYVHLNETRVTLPSGEPGILSMQMDITELKEKEEKLKYLSYHDGLTDLYNRYYLEEEMQRIDTARQLPISLIMCDVNGMKIVNDTYGHKKGDELLIKVADILRKNIRGEDVLARWAGDEFVVLLPSTDIETAREIGSRIEESCENEEFEGIPITLGIGVAAKEAITEDLDETLARADERMYKDKLTKVNSAENKLVQNMLNALAAKSAETKEHAMRISELAHKLGEKLGLPNEQLNKLSLLATLHDVGKTTISEEILTKPEKLTNVQWEIIKEHPERGHTIAAATEEFAHIAKEILHHHEHWNGDGYPENLEKEEIPLLSRLIAIVDAYDVMRTGRPYKEAVSKEEALAEIERCAGSQFDPNLAEEFVTMMRENNWNDREPDC